MGNVFTGTSKQNPDFKIHVGRETGMQHFIAWYTARLLRKDKIRYIKNSNNKDKEWICQMPSLEERKA
jgi:hypothetical protein